MLLTASTASTGTMLVDSGTFPQGLSDYSSLTLLIPSSPQTTSLLNSPLKLRRSWPLYL